jgi:hypothetical protein
MGSHWRGCPAGHTLRLHYNSCRHRSCPQCGHERVERWITERTEQLLPCDHYHVILTVPHELEPLWRANRRAMNELLLGGARETLLELLADARYLGARPGILATLHTWGRTLSFHPHVHALVSGGGWDGAGWRPVRNGFLLPFRVVGALFRGKLLAAVREALAAGRLVLPAGESRARLERELWRLSRRRWNVHLRERYAQARGVLVYLSRYLRSGPIHNRRLLAVDDAQVVFRYTDHRDAQSRSMRLALEAFLQRLLWHVPEPRSHVVRHWGLYARGRKAVRERCRAQLAATTGEPRARVPSAARAPAPDPQRERCEVCGRALVFLGLLVSCRSPPPLAPR